MLIEASFRRPWPPLNAVLPYFRALVELCAKHDCSDKRAYTLLAMSVMRRLKSHG